MKPKSPMDDVRVGLFVLIALALLVVGTLWVAGRSLSGGGGGRRLVRLPDAGGLGVGDTVRAAGVPVGRVAAVRLRPGIEPPVELEVVFHQSLDLRADAAARLSTAGLLGSPVLEIDTGSAAAPLAADAAIPGQAAPGLDAAMARVDEIAVQVLALLDDVGAMVKTVAGRTEPLLDRVDALLSAENAAEIGAILKQARQVLETTGPRLDSLLAKADGLAGDAGAAARDLPELTAALKDLAADLQAAVGPDGERISRLLETGEHTLASADDALTMLGDNRAEIEALLRDLRETSAHLKAFSRQVSERPWSLVRIKPEPDRTPGQGAAGGRP